MLEKRFLDSVEYVELHEDNYDTFSNGYALLIQAIGAELDIVFKEFCGFNTSDRKKITDYAQCILTSNQEIVNIKIMLQEYDIEIQPFKTWNINQPAQSLQWWTAFTDESSKLFTLKSWTSRAVPMNEVFAVLGDMLEDGDGVFEKKFDV